MSRAEVSDSGQGFQDGEQACPVFGVENGGPLIGIGVLLILFAIIPLFLLRMPLPVPAALLFAGFGVFLIWTGITK
jgi:hypothetical protein